MEFTWTDALRLGLTGGLFAGIANQLVGVLRDLVGINADRARRREERQHETDLRADEAHIEARRKHAQQAAEVRGWIDRAWTDAYGLDVDYYHVVTPKSAASDPGDAVSRLFVIRDYHPTGEVRELARDLARELEHYYNDITIYQGMEGEAIPPHPDVFQKWTDLAEELQERVLTPRLRPSR